MAEPLGGNVDGQLERQVPAVREPSETSDDGVPPDQVPRKLAYQRVHPGVRFTPPCVHEPMWTAVLDGGAVEIRALDLVSLMDKLDRLEADGDE